jgi:hypothetical protein
MSIHVRRSLTATLAGCLVIAASGAASAQAEIEGGSPSPDATRVPELAEVALCEMPELGEPAGGSVGPRIASAAAPARGRAGRSVPIANADPFDPAVACTFPVVDVIDPFTGETREGFLFTDVGRPGLMEEVHMFPVELSRGEVRRITRQRGVATAGRLQPGTYTGVVIDHGRIPDDVGVNLLTNFDENPFDDTPAETRNPDSPLAGGDGMYSIFGDGRAFVTDFPGEFYAGNVRRNPFAAMRTGDQTTFLIPSDGHGTTVAPSIFERNAAHWIDILPNGALPVDGRVALFPGCLAQHIVHLPLLIAEEPVSASTDWVTSCYPLGVNIVGLIQSNFVGPDPLRVGIDFESFDPGATEARPQGTYAEVWVDGPTLYVRFPSGLLQYGYHRVLGPSFDPTGDTFLDAVLRSVASTLDEYIVPVAVNESEGLIQGLEECLPPGEQVRDPVG